MIKEVTASKSRPECLMICLYENKQMTKCEKLLQETFNDLFLDCLWNHCVSYQYLSYNSIFLALTYAHFYEEMEIAVWSLEALSKSELNVIVANNKLDDQIWRYFCC